MGFKFNGVVVPKDVFDAACRGEVTPPVFLATALVCAHDGYSVQDLLYAFPTFQEPDIVAAMNLVNGYAVKSREPVVLPQNPPYRESGVEPAAPAASQLRSSSDTEQFQRDVNALIGEHMTVPATLSFGQTKDLQRMVKGDLSAVEAAIRMMASTEQRTGNPIERVNAYLFKLLRGKTPEGIKAEWQKQQAQQSAHPTIVDEGVDRVREKLKLDSEDPPPSGDDDAVLEALAEMGVIG